MRTYKSHRKQYRTATLEAELRYLREILRDVACSGLEFEDARLSYVVVQVDRETWARLQAFRQDEHADPR
jgi:hypothetical protein